MRPWYRFGRFLFRTYFRLYHRGRVVGAENVPATGPCVLAGNHVSFLDPPFFGLACRREMYFLARDTLFRWRPMGWLLRSWNCVPVRREGGDLAAMRTVLRLLEQGQAVLIFPEGTRSRDGRLQEARPGIGMIVARARVPVVPMRIFGTERALPRDRWWPRPVGVTVVIGKPFEFPAPAGETAHGSQGKELYREIGREVMRRIASLSVTGGVAED
ncbi:MAG: 1-acyl-sn-glycerol-3-phosphate acyltransferase, partial [Verrucomicrobiae bacterium]|nr:1-acyl-sn-glycerol-3-phosphate acyltransferase [Verrucomicrobiae bacterium]